MKKLISILLVLVLCLSWSVSTAERKTVEKDQFYLGAMRVIRCRDYVSLRETPDKTGKVLAKVPLNAIVLYCSNNISKYTGGKYKKQKEGMYQMADRSDLINQLAASMGAGDFAQTKYNLALKQPIILKYRIYFSKSIH